MVSSLSAAGATERKHAQANATLAEAASSPDAATGETAAPIGGVGSQGCLSQGAIAGGAAFAMTVRG